jgi:hypothetical protein
MANHSTMGPGGVAVDMATGKPIIPRPTLIQNKARERFQNAVSEAWDISLELHQNSAVLKVFVREYQNRLMELANADPVCKALMASMAALRFKLEKAPLLAEAEALRVLGHNLAGLAQEETEAAP